MIADGVFVIIIYAISIFVVLKVLFNRSTEVNALTAVFCALAAPILIIPLGFIALSEIKLKKDATNYPTVTIPVTKPKRKKNTTNFYVNPKYKNDLAKALEKTIK